MSFYCLPEWVIRAIDCIRCAFFGRALEIFREGFAWLTGNLFALTRAKLDWVFAISDLSIMPSLPSGGIDFFHDPHASWVDLVTYNYSRRRKAHDLYGHVSPFWRGILKASTAFASGIKIDVGDGCTTRFWLDHWVGNDALASIFPNLFAVARDPSATVITQTCLFEGNRIWAPLFRRWSHQLMGAHLYDELNSLLTFFNLSSAPRLRICGGEN